MKLNLRNQMRKETVSVPAEFIDHYMPAASGDAVKVYLCLIGASQDPSRELTLGEMADLFDLTEKKLSQLLLYWEEQGLLAIERNGGEICGLELLKFGSAGEQEMAGEQTEAGKPEILKDSGQSFRVRPASQAVPRAEAVRTETIQPEEPREMSYREIPETPMNLHDLDDDDAFSELLGLAEFYLKRPMTSTQRESLGNCYMMFGRKSDVIEYLLEYCIEQGHLSFHYIETVARNWKREGLNTLSEIRSAAADRNRSVYSIKKAFGITNRALVKDESGYVERWMDRFELPLILEACGRTMSAIHNPSFQYTDGILKAWEEKGVRELSDVAELDRERKAKQEKAFDQKPAAAARNTFRNFEQRDTDYSALIPNYYEG